MPEFENGYYLASYKCLCKANYEFPFIDYGSSYFEGATVEKEYDKKIKGQPNIYDRLKCRPITLRSVYGRKFWDISAATSSLIKNNNSNITNYYFTMFLSIIVYLRRHLYF